MHGSGRRKGFTIGMKDLAFIVAILALIVIMIIVFDSLLLGKVPDVLNTLVDKFLGGLTGGGGGVG